MALEMAQLDKEEVVRRLNSWGPEQEDYITNSFVLQLLLAHISWPFISFLTCVLGIHATWLDSKDFVQNYKMYLDSSVFIHQPWLEANPDQEWRYLECLRLRGNLYCPGKRLLLPTPTPWDFWPVTLPTRTVWRQYHSRKNPVMNYQNTNLIAICVF